MEDLPYVIYACFVLHNICEINNKHVQQDMVSAAQQYEREFQLSVEPNNYRVAANEVNEKKIRQTFKAYFE